ncbi:hypothetical protein D9M73_168730 [compost metagenome]
MVEEGTTGQQGDVLLAGVDQVIVFLARRRAWAHAQQAVFAVQEHFLVTQVVGHQGRCADAQVYIRAFLDVCGHALGHLGAGELFGDGHGRPQTALAIEEAAAPVTATTRWTKIPGVMMCSGSSSPSSTTWSTWAMAVLAAMAMIGPKLRAALR